MIILPGAMGLGAGYVGSGVGAEWVRPAQLVEASKNFKRKKSLSGQAEGTRLKTEEQHTHRCVTQ